MLREVIRLILAVAGWGAFTLIFADAIDSHFDLEPRVLNGLFVMVVIGVVATIAVGRDRK